MNNYTIIVFLSTTHTSCSPLSLSLTTVSPLSPCSPAPGAPRCTRCPAAQLRNNTPPLPGCSPRPCVSWSGGWRWCSAAQRGWDPPSGDCSTCPMCWHCTSMFMYVQCTSTFQLCVLCTCIVCVCVYVQYSYVCRCKR